MALSAVRAALDTVVLPSGTISELDELRAEQKRIVDAGQRLLPMESKLREHYEQEYLRLDAKIKHLTSAFSDLPKLDPIIMSWTKRQKIRLDGSAFRMTLRVPTFAYLPVTERGVTLRVYRGLYRREANLRPNFVDNYYSRAMAKVARHTGPNWGDRESVSLRYTFDGAVPENIREIVNAEERFSKREMAFICEVDEWKVSSTKRPPRLLDPILVGVKDEAFWVLGSFDPTPLEDYLTREFTS